MTSLFYDIIIYGFLLFDLLIIAGFIIGWLRIGRRSFTAIPIAVFLFMLVAGGIVFYGSFIEPKKLTVTEYQWTDISPEVENTMDGIKMAVISDFHIGPYKGKDWVQKVSDKLKTLEPDILIIDGDSVYENFDAGDAFLPLAEVKPKFGKFAVLGNHDYSEITDEIPTDAAKANAQKVHEALEKAGVKVLVNESVEIGDKLVLGGIDDLWTLRADVAETFAGKDPKKTWILMAHNPDTISYLQNSDVDFVVSGHTHAGQIRLPFWGSVPQIPTGLGKKFDQGLFHFDYSSNAQIPLLITRGLGESGPRARLLAPPEIVVIN